MSRSPFKSEASAYTLMPELMRRPCRRTLSNVAMSLNHEAATEILMVELYIAEELTDTRQLGGKKVHFGPH
jgi:hypothetical protein